MSLRPVPAAAMLCLSAALLGGCGGGEFDTAPVRGKLTCGGQPITFGSVSFSPLAPEGSGLPGKAAIGKVQPDGTFVLSTYEAEDGAVVGRHRVSWAPPEEGSQDSDDGDGEAVPAALAARLASKPGAKLPCANGGTAEVEVIDGDNDLTVDLSPVRTRAPDSDD